MKIKMVLPALTAAKSPFLRPIRYTLFPPLGLATLAAYCAPEDSVELQDERVETLVILSRKGSSTNNQHPTTTIPYPAIA